MEKAPQSAATEGETSLYEDIIRTWKTDAWIRASFGNVADYAQHREDEHFSKHGIVRLDAERVKRAHVSLQNGTGGRESPGADHADGEAS